jgi:hypothetical protein
MALHVSDAGPLVSKKIKFKLHNSTEIEIVFVIGNKSFTLQPAQSKYVRAGREVSIEARLLLIGVDSGFLVGGVKNDCTILCSLE